MSSMSTSQLNFTSRKNDFIVHAAQSQPIGHRAEKQTKHATLLEDVTRIWISLIQELSLCCVAKSDFSRP